MSDKLLVVEDLRTYFYTYGGVVKAVDGVTFDVERGETVGLVGETGCGKSTVALSILRLVPPPGRIVSGRIVFGGENLLEKSEEEMRKIRGSKISIVFQDPSSSLNPVLKIGDQVSEPLVIHLAMKLKEAWRKALEILKGVGIPDAEKRMVGYPHELSGGMKQRVMIAMALACRPALLIADEPTTNLDVTIQAQILELMKDLQRKYGLSILLITHNLGVVAQMCNRVAVMYAGQLAEFAPVRNIFHEPLHPYTKALLEAIPRVDKRGKKLASIPGSVPNLVDPPPGCRFHPRCPYAREECRREEPPLAEVGSKHVVACHLYG